MTQIAHYTVQSELGRGGMGTVYRGLDTRNNQVVAIKLLKNDVAQPETIERFKREGEALRELNHPNIVKMLDMFEHEGQHYLVMEYIRGSDLRELINRQGTIDSQTCLNMAIDLADALTRAHRLNIIHRDLKPANVLIGDDGVLRLTDFGVAHVGGKERVTDPDAIFGTVNYLPPEAFTGGTYDARSDIWAFGIMIFQMISGQRPFLGDTIGATIHAILNEPLPDLEHLCPDAPVALIDLVYRMLERDSQARIPSVRIVGAELEAILAGRTTANPRKLFDTDSEPFSVIAKSNLPAQATPFVGRQHELLELGGLLQDAALRLITLIAPGGMGKTRLAIEAGQHARRYFDESVYLVELAALNNATSIVPAIADALNYTFQNDERSTKQQLLDYLANKTCLLILDNYEHVMDGAGLVSDILAIAPNVQILVTSRQRLMESGETLFHLSGMDFPHWQTTDDPMDFAAVQLFINSAKRIVSSFELNDQNLADVIEICRMVDGMPLGIILAASWLGILSTSEVVAEMQQGISFLETDETDLPERQRSIRAVMNYTWQTMSDIEQEIFMQTSVFLGSFTREAVQTITGASLRNLMTLANKSLLHRNADTGRYTIHEMLRQYAAEQLQKSGKEIATREKHMAFYADHMTTYEKNYRDTGQLVSSMRIFERDIENIQAAWQYASDNAKLDIIDELMSGLFHFYDTRGWVVKGGEVFGRTADIVKAEANDAQPILLGKLLARQAKFLFYRGAHEQALGALQESLRRIEDTDNDDELAFTLSIFADVLSYSGDFAGSQAMCERSLVIFRNNNDRWGIATALNNLGVVYYYLEDYEQAITHYEESMAISREIGDLSGVAAILSNLGAIAHDQQKYERAIELYHESMYISEKLHDPYGIAAIHLNLGWSLFITDNYQQAHDYTIQSIEAANRLGNRWLLTTGHINMGAIACELGDLQIAKRHLSLAYQLIRNLNATNLLPDLIVGLSSLLDQQEHYTQALDILHFGKQLPGIENETSIRLTGMIEDISVQLQDKKVEYEPKMYDNNSIDRTIVNLLS